MLLCSQCGFLFDITRSVENSKGTERDFYVCKNCSHTKPIEDGFVLYKKSKTQGTNEINPKHAMIDTYSRRSNYTCITKDCPSHKKGELGELTIIKSGFNIKYMCRSCGVEQPIKT